MSNSLKPCQDDVAHLQFDDPSSMSKRMALVGQIFSHIHLPVLKYVQFSTSMTGYLGTACGRDGRSPMIGPARPRTRCQRFIGYFPARAAGAQGLIHLARLLAHLHGVPT